MNARRGTARVGAVVLVAAALLVGCSEEATSLDTDATEQAVAEVVSARIAPRVVDTRCPVDIPLGEGEVVDCTLTLAATVGPDEPKGSDDVVDPEDAEGTLRVRVTQADDDGKLVVVLRDAVVQVSDVADDLRAQLKSTFERSFQVSCGEVVHRVVRPGGTFTCRARDKGGPRTVEVTVEDAAGTLRYDVLS